MTWLRWMLGAPRRDQSEEDKLGAELLLFIMIACILALIASAIPS